MQPRLDSSYYIAQGALDIILYFASTFQSAEIIGMYQHPQLGHSISNELAKQSQLKKKKSITSPISKEIKIWTQPGYFVGLNSFSGSSITLSIKPKLPNCYSPEAAPWDSTFKSERRKGGGQILGEKTLACPHASNSLPPTRLHDGSIALCFRSVFKTSSSKRPTDQTGAPLGAPTTSVMGPFMHFHLLPSLNIHAQSPYVSCPQGLA